MLVPTTACYTGGRMNLNSSAKFVELLGGDQLKKTGVMVLIMGIEDKQWVLKTINDAWRTNKSRIKAKHFKSYDNDDDRLANRPEEVPLEVFKVLLQYWNDENVKLKAETNTSSRSCIKDSHTSGRISFAQLSKIMKIQDPEHKSPTKATVFVETRKRKKGNEYKSKDDVLTFRLDKIKQVQAAGGKTELIEPLISGEKEHGSSWLIGRHVNVKKLKKNSNQPQPNDEDYVNDLTAKIRGQLEEEMEDKVNQKVQESLSLMLTKLGEVNPNLKVNLEDVIAGRSGSSCNKHNETSSDV